MKTPNKMTKVQECAACGKRAREMKLGDGDVSVCLKCLNKQSRIVQDEMLKKQWEASHPSTWSSFMPRRSHVGTWARILQDHGEDIVRLGLIEQHEYDNFLKTGVFRGAVANSKHIKKTLKVKLGRKKSRRVRGSVYR